MKTMKYMAIFLGVVLILGAIYAYNMPHYKVIDSGIKFGYIYTIYQHRNGTKIGCYNTTERPQDPSKCINLETQESVPFPEHDVE